MRAAVLAVAVGLCLAGCPAAREPARPPAPSASSQASVMTVPADYVAVLHTAGRVELGGGVAMTPTDRNASYVVGPRYYLSLDAVGTTQRLSADSDVEFNPSRPETEPALSGRIHRPAVQASAGHELVIAEVAGPGTTLGGDPGGMAGTPADRTAHDVSVRVGQDPAVRLGGFVSSGSQVLVSVPSGADPLIVIDDHSGHPQSLHLRTGQRADALGVLYPPRRQDLDTLAASTLVIPGDGRQYQEAVALGVSVSLVPWDRVHGWAPPGRAWLLVALDLRNVGDRPFYGKLTLDAARTFTLTGAGGGAVRAVPGTAELWSAVGTTPQSAEARFDVPDSFRTGTLRVALAGTVAPGWLAGPPQPIRVGAAQNTSAQITLPA
jgi:hypothetical protein